MFNFSTAVRAVAASVLASSALAAPNMIQAQVTGRGFLFGQPHGSLTLSAGVTQPSANSDIYSFVHDQLTVGKKDFLGASFGANFDVRLANRLSLQLNSGYYGRAIDSETRNFIDNNDNPIQQSTALRKVPIMVGLRYDLTSPGRSLGTLAWVPSRFTPYVAAGGGAMWYRFHQEGDFVDYQTLNVVPLSLQSTGWTGAAYGALGADISLGPIVSLRTEARYDEARGTLSRDFAGFNRIDLSGLNATIGLSFRY